MGSIQRYSASSPKYAQTDCTSLFPTLNQRTKYKINVFQVCFKDGLNGTRDYRALAGLISLFPIVFVASRELIFTPVGITPALAGAINLIITCCIITYIQPCKSAIANISLSLNLFLLSGLYITRYLWFGNLFIPTETLTLVFIITPVISNGFVCAWATYKLVHLAAKHRMCIRHCVCSTILTNGIKTFCYRRRGGEYQELT